MEETEEFDKKMMRRCIFLAEKGLGHVAPNPMVGCVITIGKTIVSEGWHAKFGEQHAERMAIGNLPTSLLNRMHEATLYVNLEPCAHEGKTPPCAPLVASMGFKRVVIANKDPFKQVNGKGIEILKDSGIEVKTGVLEKECRWLNRRFFTLQEKGRPYVILKWAQSSDDFIARVDSKNKPIKTIISNKLSLLQTHRMRANEMSILVGSGTVMCDDPMLTVRNCNGENPIRLVVDKDLECPMSAHVFDGSVQTIVYNSKKSETAKWGEWVKLDFSENIIPQLLADLGKRSISSMIVEGGYQTLQSFIDSGMWDECREEVATEMILTQGVPCPKLKEKEEFRSDNFEGHSIKWYRNPMEF